MYKQLPVSPTPSLPLTSPPPATLTLTANPMAGMETVVAVAIGILAAVFLGSLLALLFVCRHKYCQHRIFSTGATRLISPDLDTEEAPKDPLELEQVDLGLPLALEEILRDQRWVGDASGLVPHCLAVLKTCHQLTERLIASAMGPLPPSRLQEMGRAARRISPRVDDVVRALYPPLDARLLEARSAALVLSVSHLALLTRSLTAGPRGPGAIMCCWVEDTLADVDRHLLVLREAALAQEAGMRANQGQTPEVPAPDLI